MQVTWEDIGLSLKSIIVGKGMNTEEGKSIINEVLERNKQITCEVKSSTYIDSFEYK